MTAISNKLAWAQAFRPSIRFSPRAASNRRGQIYYVVSDPQSGRELAELPPKEIRNAREGVADYLKQQSQNRVPGQSIKTEA